MQKLISILSGLFIIMNAYNQPVSDYIISDITPTFISNPPVELKLKDTLDSERKIYKADDILGGLKPRYPMAKTYESPEDITAGYIKCFRKFTTLSHHCTNYIVLKDSILTEINSEEKFKELFAPVEDEEEALSFAYALSGIFHPKAIYNFDFLKCKECDYEVYKKIIYPTYSKRVEGGYEVLIYSTYWGFTSYCTECIFFVSTDGNVSLKNHKYIFEDKNFNLIID